MASPEPPPSRRWDCIERAFHPPLGGWNFLLAGFASPVQAWRMDEPAITIRQAVLTDAAQIARVYIESWHDTYAAILPKQLLCAMTPRGQTARWHAALSAKSRERVLVAQSGRRLVGM